MKIGICVFALLLIIMGCNHKAKEIRNLKVNNEYSKIDTIYSNDIALDLKENSESHHPLEKLKFLDKNNKKLLEFSRDTIFLRVLFHSEKFPNLNKDYEITIDPVSDNMKVLDQVSRNKVQLFIEPDSNPFVFDVYLRSKKNVFKSSYVDSNKKITYTVDPVIFLFRKTIMPS
ncbi:hypothetical protein [Fluviicola taffensis]|uniref:hypothetical protein n=1 Tax=Fluviicola taffensis TaxID=191579 RepID=UPI003137E9F3